MDPAAAEQIIALMDQASQLYHRLVLVVSPSGGGKTRVLRDVGQRTGSAYLNVSLELSRRLLDVSVQRRPLHVAELLRDALGAGDGPALLDNAELLFDPSLKQDPLSLLQGLSRYRTIVAAWSGSLEGSHLTYAAPGHPEYRRYPTADLLIVDL